MKALNSGCGSSGFDLNLGWNWQPSIQGCAGISQFSIANTSGNNLETGLSLVLAGQCLELLLKCAERPNHVSGALPHAEVVGDSAEPGIRFCKLPNVPLPKRDRSASRRPDILP